MKISHESIQKSTPEITSEALLATSPQRRWRKLHQRSCGCARAEYDNYLDVLAACNRKLAEWESAGIIPSSHWSNDWLFCR